MDISDITQRNSLPFYEIDLVRNSLLFYELIYWVIESKPTEYLFALTG